MAIAAQSGVGDFRAGPRPEEKQQAVRQLGAKHAAVAMVGDGVNDAPALAAATGGSARDHAGTDVALDTADVALMSDALDRLPYAIGLGRATQRIIRQNLAVAIGAMAVRFALTLAGKTTISQAVFSHEGSTLVVPFNALRLLGYRAR